MGRSVLGMALVAVACGGSVALDREEALPPLDGPAAFDATAEDGNGSPAAAAGHV